MQLKKKEKKENRKENGSYRVNASKGARGKRE